MSFVPEMVNAQILYDNVLRASGATVAYDGTVVDGFEPVNAYDWRDFSLFRPQATKVLQTDLVAASLVNSVCVWWNAAGSNTVLVEGWNGAAWVALVTVSQSAGTMQWVDFAGVSFTKYRFTFDGANDIRQITLGARFQFPMGQWQGIAPPQLLHGVVVENIISVNGSIIGRNIRRVVKEGLISLNYLDPAWVRSSWNNFAIHASRYAFWWRWDPVSHPTEIGFTVADKIEAPKNSNPPGKMEVSMPLLYLA
jgi:hypothetical protein